MSEKEIMFIEKIEETFYSLDRKAYNLKVIRLEDSNVILESGISINETPLKNEDTLKSDNFINDNVQLLLSGRQLV